MSECKMISHGEGKFRITANIHRIGRDTVLLVMGGEKPHAGCVVTCEPDRASGSVTSSVHSFTGHREEQVARPIAEAACRKLKTKIVCICGIHVDNASKGDIALLVKNTNELGKRILKCI